MATNNGSAQVQKTVAQLIKNVSDRNRDVVSRRFGLTTGKKETLESIGQRYGITRERVRQLEEFTLGQLAKSAVAVKETDKYLSFARAALVKNGGVMKERDLFKTFSGSEKDSVTNSSLVFLMTLDKDLVRFGDNDHLHAFWSSDGTRRDAFLVSVQTLNSAFENHGSIVPAGELISFASKNGVTANGSDSLDKHLRVVMSIWKDIGSNIFNEIGLAHWPHIHPKGVRDKAYLVMKKSGKPEHFSGIAKLINAAGFENARKSNIQTVHNELIKDPRFVLVGRGMYALAEWGYKAGTVKDVLVDILKNASKPLTRTELVAKVKDARLVKENTILLSLQDSKSFAHNTDGTYTLRKA